MRFPRFIPRRRPAAFLGATLGVVLLFAASYLWIAFDIVPIPDWQADGQIVAGDPFVGGQDNPITVTDGSGNSLIVWNDSRNGDRDIFAMLLDADGTELWPAGGVAVVTAENDQRVYDAIHDGANFFIAWEDDRTDSGAYVQKLDADGTSLWTADGVWVTDNDWDTPQMVSDGSGGVIVSGYHVFPTDEIAIQRVDSDGDQPWGTEGVSLGPANSEPQKMVADSSAGAYVTWGQFNGTDYDVYVSRVTGAGTINPLFGAGGLALQTDGGGTEENPRAIVADGAGGAIIVFEKGLAGNGDVFAQRIDGDGVKLWDADGMPIVEAAGHQSYFVPAHDRVAVADGFGGVITAWADERLGSSQIYAQRLDADGNIQWTRDGVLVGRSGSAANTWELDADGEGGAAVAFTQDTELHIAFLAPETGAFLYGGLVVVASAANDQIDPSIAAGASFTVSWRDDRDDGSGDIYAQHYSFGTPPDPFYRWRSDDGGEAIATFKAPPGIPVSLGRDNPARLRFSIANPASGSNLHREAAVEFLKSEHFLRAAVIDEANGYAYFGTEESPGQVSKVNLSTFERVGGITLGAGEDAIVSAVIDTANGFAYFGTLTGVIAKVALGDGDDPPVEVDSLAVEEGEEPLRTAVIDEANGYAYFGTETGPGTVVKINLATFERVGAVTLEEGEDNLYSAVIDTAGGYAYFGTLTDPGTVVKVALGDGDDPPTRVGAVTLDPGEELLTAAVIDPGNGYAYFGTHTDPGLIVKVELGAGDDPPSRVDVGTMNAGEAYLNSAVIDTANGFAYFGSGGFEVGAPHVVKVDLGVGSAAPSRVDAVTLEPEDENLTSAVIDLTNGKAYFGSFNFEPGRVTKIDLGSFMVDSFIELFPGEQTVYAAVIDPAGEFGYFGTQNMPGFIVKVDLATMERVDVIALPDGEGNTRSAVIDPAGEFAYFSSGTDPGRVVKIDLDPFGYVGSIELDPGEDFSESSSAVMDPAGEFAYFGTVTSPGRVVKVDLDPFARVDGITADPGEDFFFSANIDSAGEYIYFGTQTDPAILVKVDTDPLARVDALAFESGEFSIRSGFIDPDNQFGYFGTETDPGIIVKVDLVNFARLGDITLEPGEGNLFGVVSDSAGAFAYFRAGGNPAKIVKIDLGAFARVDVRELMGGESNVDTTAAIIDPSDQYAYFSASGGLGGIVKTSLTGAPLGLRLEYGLKETDSCGDTSFSQLPGPDGGEAWEMSPSAYLSDGEATINSGGLPDTAVLFTPGEAKDVDSQTAPILLPTNWFTEVEFSVKPTTAAVANATYCFRLTDEGEITDITEFSYAEALVLAQAQGSPARGARPPGGGPVCGNALCENGESFSTCASDCPFPDVPPAPPPVPGTPPSLMLAKSALRADPTPTALNSVRLFGTVRYRITVTNVGGSTAYRTVIRDPLPPQLDYLQNSVRLNGAPQTDAADGDTTTYNPVARELRLSLPPIPPGESRVFTFDTKPVRTIDGSIIRNKVFANYSDELALGSGSFLASVGDGPVRLVTAYRAESNEVFTALEDGPQGVALPRYVGKAALLALLILLAVTVFLVVAPHHPHSRHHAHPHARHHRKTRV